MKNKTVIIYHKEDNDGLFSMSIAYNYLVNELNIDALDIELMGMDYKDMIEFAISLDMFIKNHEDSYVIMTDISANANAMQQLYEHYSDKFFWFDHHKPIIEESKKNNHTFGDCSGIRRTDRSALLNVYSFFYDPLDEHYNDKTMPQLFRVLSAYDSWTFDQEGYLKEDAVKINLGTNFKFDLNPDSIIELCYNLLYCNSTMDSINDLYHCGSIIAAYNEQRFKNIIKQYGDVWNIEKDNSLASVIFTQDHTNSLSFKNVNKRITHGIACKYSKGMWSVSLYNVNDDCEFNCGQYVKEKYGGGGHKGAAGCQLTNEQFFKILDEKMF